MYEGLLHKKKKLAVIGLGYVGLPIALEFAKHLSVIGFDINEERVQMMRKNIDPSRELESSAFAGCDIQFTADIEALREANFFIVAVPTPLGGRNLPDLRPVLLASETIGKVIKKGDYVVYESTVYPGCTEEDCVPVIEELSGLKMTEDFMIGYSPERINPGDKERNITNIIKIVSGCCATSLDEIAKVYEIVVKAGVYRAASVKVAEAAKIIENTQRDLNIALMNELSVIFSMMNINTFEVLEAAGTKWNFLKFQPGLVGGHCIGIDPYYLTYKSKKLGYDSQVILAGRKINDGMAEHVAKKILQYILSNTGSVKDARVLIMGVTFKENVSDIRNSKVADVISELRSFSLEVDVVDPYADVEEMQHEYGINLLDKPAERYNAVLIAVPHREFTDMSDDDFVKLTRPDALIFDLKGIYRARIKSRAYASL